MSCWTGRRLGEITGLEFPCLRDTMFIFFKLIAIAIDCGIMNMHRYTISRNFCVSVSKSEGTTIPLPVPPVLSIHLGMTAGCRQKHRRIADKPSDTCPWIKKLCESGRLVSSRKKVASMQIAACCSLLPDVQPGFSFYHGQYWSHRNAGAGQMWHRPGLG